MTGERYQTTTPIETSPIESPGSIITSLRDSNGWSQADLARAASISQGYISQLENGEFGPGPEITINLARALGVCIEFLEGKSTSEVFLRHEARMVEKMKAQPQTAKTVDFLNNYIPNLPDPGLVYIEQFGSKEPINRKILRLREQKGWIQRTLAAESSLNQGYISQLESGEVQNPSHIVLTKLSGALGVSTKELLGIVEIKPDEAVVAVDRFFRSKEVPLSAKTTVRKTIEALEEMVNDPFLNPPKVL